MVGTLYTLGYAGLRGASDLRALVSQRAASLDVRIRTYLGDRAFSAPTRATVEGAGYVYRWLSGLGNAEYNTGGMRLAKPEEIGTLVDLLRAGTDVAIMLVCRDVATCHRRLVAETAAERVPDLQVIDL